MASASAVEEAVHMRTQQTAEVSETTRMIQHHQRQCHLCQVGKEESAIGRAEGCGSAVETRMLSAMCIDLLEERMLEATRYECGKVCATMSHR